MSLQPFQDPVCTPEGQIFDHENIIRWLLNHDANPTNGKSLRQADLIKLNFAQNDAGDFVDPVTFKEFTDNSHVVAVRHADSANVFAYDTLERLNFKPKMWRDLVSDEEFTKKDLIVLQDPMNLESRDLNSFKYLKDGEDSGVPKEEASVNKAAMGNAAKILKAKEAVAKARAERAAGGSVVRKDGIKSNTTTQSFSAPKVKAYNATKHTTGLAAASFTSTGVTPHTSASLALMSDEEYLLKKGRVKQKGYARIGTSLGDVTVELYPEHAPKAVWNFVQLAKKGYYNGIKFHRNIKNFMIQGGDPTGTGRGGSSIWGKNFDDEFPTPLRHDVKGIMSMANKGKNTNSSQFFITYRKTPHLDGKHTIFGKTVDSDAILTRLEEAETDGDKPVEDIIIEEVVVYVDPFEEFQKQRQANEIAGREQEKRKQEGADDDNRTTWTGKRIRTDGTVETGGSGVGKYLKARIAEQPVVLNGENENVEFVDDPFIELPKKKAKSGFGNFDGW